MLYIVLIFLFIGIFAFLGWRILNVHAAPPPPADAFVCPHCNEKDCICHKK